MDIGNYVNSETCHTLAQERIQKGDWQEALVLVHIGLTNKKAKSNMLILEKLMTLMINICV